MTEETQDHPRVVARPPFLYLSFLVAGVVVGLFSPLPLVDEPQPVRIAGGLLLLAGVALMSLCLRRFSAAGTNVPTYLPVKALVVEGPYRLSRNPIYVGMTAIYVGVGLLLNSGWVLILAIPLLLVMRYGVIAREERFLEEKFGAPYRDYKTRVRRWL